MNLLLTNILVAFNKTTNSSINLCLVFLLLGFYANAQNAVLFNGTTDYIEYPYSASNNPAQFTVEFWARVDGGNGTFRTPVSSRYSNNGTVSTRVLKGYNFYAAANNTWVFNIGDGITGHNWTSLLGPAVVNGQWTHLAATYDGTTYKFYVNGVLASSIAVGTSYDPGDGIFNVGNFAPNTSSPLRIGAGVTESTPQFKFNGAVDDVQIWSGARTASQIYNDLNTTDLTLPQAGLANYYQFENVGALGTSKTGDNSPGTLYGAPTQITRVYTTTAIPDPNFEAALRALGLDGSAGGVTNDGLVLTSNISGRTTLDVNGKSISNLAGIQDFTALTTLACYNNSLTSLNVSSNINLTYLDCHTNSLTSLDVTSNNNLTYLDCGANLTMTSLIVGNKPVLSRLACYSNQLISLDLSQCPTLWQLVAYVCDLRSLDLSQNHALTYAEVQVNPNLSSLNIKNGNNANITGLYTGSTNLSCIQADSNTAPPSWQVQANQFFSIDCSAPTVTVGVSKNPLNEGESAVITARLSGTRSFPVTLTYALSGTATTTTDYTIASPATITIAAGQSSGTLTLAAVADALDTENTETVVLTATATNGTLADATPITITINDVKHTTQSVCSNAAKVSDLPATNAGSKLNYYSTMGGAPLASAATVTTGTYYSGLTTTLVSGLSVPWATAIDAAGNLYTTDTNNNTIVKSDPSGALLATFNGGSPGTFNAPRGIAVDAAGNIYVSNNFDGSIKKMNASGVLDTGFSAAGGGAGIVLDTSGNLYPALNGAVKKINSTTGAVISTFSLPGELRFSRGIDIDAAGNLYVASQGPDGTTCNISIVDPTGVITKQFTGLPVATFTVTVDAGGNIYKVEQTGLITKMDVSGTVLATYAASDYGFNQPLGVTLDASGNLLVTNGAGNNVVKIANARTAVNVTVNALPAPTFTAQPAAVVAVNTDVTYTTQTGQTNYIWTIPGVLNTDYSITSGGTTATNTVTLQWKTIGSKAITVNYANSNGCTSTAATSSNATNSRKYGLTSNGTESIDSNATIDKNGTKGTSTTVDKFGTVITP